MFEGAPDVDELSVAVCKGVSGAVWDVIGSLAIVVFSFLLAMIGLAFASAALQGDGMGMILAGTVGVVLVLVGVLQFLREFDTWQ